MTTVERLTSALGQPRALREVADGPRFLGAVGRWRHEGAQVDLSGLETVQVVFNVSGGQRVELHTRAGAVCQTVRAGSVGIVMPGLLTRVTVTGRADTVQIVLSRELIRSSADRRFAFPSSRLATREASLRAAVVQAFMELARGGLRGRDSLERALWQVAYWLATSSAVPPSCPSAKGGLSPAARRRVCALMDARLQTDGCSPLTVDELAAAAGLSVHHFIKAFRQTEGSTPHARVTGRRLDLALDLLLRADARVGWIALQTGFSSPAHFVSTFRKHLGVTPGALCVAASDFMARMPSGE